eukprot:gene4862-6619_t
MAKIVFSGFVMLCRLAGWPTSTSPVAVKATMDGVVRAPSAFSMTLATLPSITATQEFVVPRSMPIAFVMIALLWRDPHQSGKFKQACPERLRKHRNLPKGAHLG